MRTSHQNSKILSLEQLKERVQTGREDFGFSFILANGIFDILHPGHIEYLYKASRSADVLIVAINSDRATSIIKGNTRPILEEEARATLISSLECVDFVIIVDDVNMIKIIEEIKPNFLARGADCDTLSESVEVMALKKCGGSPTGTGISKPYSTTKIIDKIKGFPNYPPYKKPDTNQELITTIEYTCPMCMRSVYPPYYSNNTAMTVLCPVCKCLATAIHKMY